MELKPPPPVEVFFSEPCTGGAYMTAAVAAVWAVAAARCVRFASGAKDFKRGAFGEAEGEFGGINSFGGKER